MALYILLQKQGILGNYTDLIQNWQGMADSKVLQSVLYSCFKDYELYLFEPNLKENEIQFFVNTFGRICVFLSSIRSWNCKEITKKHIGHSYNSFALQFNYRNTYQIYNFARYFVPDSAEANDSQTLLALRHYKNNGDLPEVLGFKSSLDLLQRICQVIDDYNGLNILIVLPEYTNTMVIKNTLQGYGHEATILDDETDLTDLKSIIITSLEHSDWMPNFEIVIFVDFQAIKDTEITKRFLYQKSVLTSIRLVITYVGEFPSILKDFPVDTYDTGDLFS